MTKLIFADPLLKVNGQYYCNVLLSQQMLPAIKHVAGDTFVFQQETLHLIVPMTHYTGLHWSSSLATKQPRPESSGS